ncbi:MAG TPA: hypothetical protein VGJ60_32390 [Chloroflexota bacterium]
MTIETANPCDPDHGVCAILLFPTRIVQRDRYATQKDYDRAVQHFADVRVMDERSGGYFYTHMAVDCCGVSDGTRDRDDVPEEICPAVPAGTRITIDAAPVCGVRRYSLADWNTRPYVRVPIRDLAKLGIRCPEFCQAVTDQLRSDFSPNKLNDPEVDPSGIVCSDVISRALEPAPRKWILAFVQAWLQRCYPFTTDPPYAARTLKTASSEIQASFIAPNGYAIAFGLPHGATLTEPGEATHVRLNLDALLAFAAPP